MPMHVANTLEEAVNNLLPQPLEADDPFYENLAGARGSKALARLELRIREAADMSGSLHMGF